MLAAVGAAASLVASATISWATRRAATLGWGSADSRASRRVAPAATSLLFAASVVVSVLSFITDGVSPREDAHASIVAVLLGFQWSAATLAFAMLLPANLWAWLDAADPRGQAVALNASLVTHFTAASGLVVFFTVYVTRWLG